MQKMPSQIWSIQSSTCFSDGLPTDPDHLQISAYKPSPGTGLGRYRKSVTAVLMAQLRQDSASLELALCFCQ
jgi:hypothetical protein